eukprot:12895175-Prorocentrum_lima.AAC.1
MPHCAACCAICNERACSSGRDSKCLARSRNPVSLGGRANKSCNVVKGDVCRLQMSSTTHPAHSN